LGSKTSLGGEVRVEAGIKPLLKQGVKEKKTLSFRDKNSLDKCTFCMLYFCANKE
jgi:hypothetical protein